MPDTVEVRLGDVTNNFDSRRVPIKTSEREPGSTPYYGASGVVDFVKGFTHDGDYLLVSEDGENLRTRSTPIAFMASGQIWVNNHAHVLEGLPGVADTRYLMHLLAITDVAGYLTGSTQPKLTRRALDSISLRVLPYASQRAIAEVLGALDDKIAANSSLAIAAHQLAKAHYDASLVGDARDASVGEILNLEYGKALPASARREGQVPVYGSGGIVGHHDYALVEGPTVIVGRKGSAGSVHWSPNSSFPIDTTFFVSPAAEVPPTFCFFALRSLRLAEMNSDSAVPGLNRNEAHAAPLRVPATDVLKAFDAAAGPLFALETQLQDESSQLGATRDALLPGLMSGKIRVKDAERVVEDVV